jgi:hypothetical protein
MSVDFEVTLVGPGVYLVTAILCDGSTVQLGTYGSVEEIDEVCEDFRADLARHVH